VTVHAFYNNIDCKAGERQPRAPGQIGEHAPSPVPLDSHADGHTKVYFLIAMNEGIASELLARNRWRISVPMARVACMHPYQQMGVINLFNTGKYIISSHKDAM
jgi:hypothetical protein